MATNTGPDIITNGLVLCLDAGDRNSYPGSGTSWTDLSGNGNNATFVNGPTFVSNNRGSFSFDGANDYASLSLSQNPSSQITVESWIYPRRAVSTGVVRGAVLSANATPSTYGHYLGIFDSADGGLTHSLHWAIETSAGRPYSQVGSIPRYSWSYIVGTYNGSRTKAYINGSLVYDAALTGTIYGNGSWSVGCYLPLPTDGTHNFDGLIGAARIYNVAFSLEQIQQSYNATKGRFGL